MQLNIILENTYKQKVKSFNTVKFNHYFDSDFIDEMEPEHVKDSIDYPIAYYYYLNSNISKEQQQEMLEDSIKFLEAV